ncbi:MAG: ATP-binding protein [Woeseia sp.]
MAKTNNDPIAGSASFRARSRILELLGNQLIGSDQLAIFELVKNSYDADASLVHVKLLDLDTDERRIIVLDDGEGMDLETILNVWLQPGHDLRYRQRSAGQRTPLFNRLPLGEKGVGRFAVHKLGEHIDLVTRRKDGSEYTVSIDWKEILKKDFLDQISVPVLESKEPILFGGRNHGTQISISRLRQTKWTRGDVRRVDRLLTALNSPFDRPEKSHPLEFQVMLEAPSREDWLADIPDADELIQSAPWHFAFSLVDGRFSWQYEFRPPSRSGIAGRILQEKDADLLLPSTPGSRKRVVAHKDDLDGIGPISGQFAAPSPVAGVICHHTIITPCAPGASGLLLK